MAASAPYWSFFPKSDLVFGNAAPSAQRQLSALQGREVRVEVGGHAVVGGWYQRAAGTGASIAGGELDAREIRFERHLFVVLFELVPGQWAAERDRGWMVGPAVGPYRLVRRTVETGVGVEATRQRQRQRIGRRETSVVVLIGGFPITLRAFATDARSGRGIDPRAEVEVTDLVGEGHVVAVCRPRDPCGRRRCRVHRVEVVGRHRAVGAGGREVDLREPVGRARRHGATLAGGEVVDLGREPVRRVAHGDDDVVALVQVEHVGARLARRHRIEVERIRRTLRRPVSRQVGKVDRLRTAEDSALTRVVELRAVDRVDRQAVDVECDAPLGGITRGPVELLHPARWIELQLRERRSGMVRAHRRVDDVGVAVGRARRHLLRVRLRVAHRHAEPERRVQHDVVRLRRAVRTRRVARDLQLVAHPVARARLLRVEQHRRLVVTDVDLPRRRPPPSRAPRCTGAFRSST